MLTISANLTPPAISTVVEVCSLAPNIPPTSKVYIVQVNVAKGEIRLVEEEMEKVMKRFTGDMHSLNKLLVKSLL